MQGWCAMEDGRRPKMGKMGKTWKIAPDRKRGKNGRNTLEKIEIQAELQWLLQFAAIFGLSRYSDSALATPLFLRLSVSKMLISCPSLSLPPFCLPPSLSHFRCLCHSLLFPTRVSLWQTNAGMEHLFFSKRATQEGRCLPLSSCAGSSKQMGSRVCLAEDLERVL